MEEADGDTTSQNPMVYMSPIMSGWHNDEGIKALFFFILQYLVLVMYFVAIPQVPFFLGPALFTFLICLRKYGNFIYAKIKFLAYYLFWS